ncbi:hypothetical protein [Thermococcus sp.]
MVNMAGGSIKTNFSQKLGYVFSNLVFDFSISLEEPDNLSKWPAESLKEVLFLVSDL